MYTVRIEAGFCATHHVRLADGSVEPPHGHDWRVRAEFARAELDDREMVVDFEAARAALCSIVAPLHHADLNEHPGLTGRNPTAEVVARHLFDRMRALGFCDIRRVEVTEAPGCVAAFGAEAYTRGGMQDSRTD